MLRRNKGNQLCTYFSLNNSMSVRAFMPKTDVYAAYFRHAARRNERHANCRDKATHNAQRCYLGRPRCNLNLIARYFGRAYACNVGRGLIKRLRAALRRHADELTRFASPGLRVPAKSKRMEDLGEGTLGCSS